MITDNVPVLALRTFYQHCPLMIALFRDSMCRTMPAWLASKGEFVGRMSFRGVPVWEDGAVGTEVGEVAAVSDFWRT